MAFDGLHIGTITTHFTANTTGLMTGIAKAQGAASGFAKGVIGSLKSLALPIAAVGTAFAAAATVSIKAATDFQKGMAEVFTLIPEESQQMYDELSKQAKEFAAGYGAKTSDVTSSLYQTISAGVDAEDAFEFLAVAEKSAVGGVTDLETSTKGLVSVVNAYGSETLDAQKASDIMFTTVKKGITTYEELSSSLFNVVPTAAALGVEMGDVGAAMATLTSIGTPTTIATTQLRAALLDLSDPGKETAKIFKELSGKTFKEFIADGGNLADALSIMEDAAKKSGVEVADMFGSVEAKAAVLGLTGEHMGVFTEDILAMGDSEGATDTAFDTMEQTFSRRIEKLQAKMEVGMINLGEALIPYAEALMDWWEENGEQIMLPLLEGFKSIQDWWSGNGEGVFTAIGDLFTWLTDTFRPLTEAYASFWGGEANDMTIWWEENGELIMEAVGVIMDAIKTMIEYIVLVWSWVWPYLEDILGGFIDVVLGIVKLFAAVITGDWDAAGEALVEITKGLMEIMFGIMALGWDAIATGIEIVMNGISQFITDVWAGIVKTFENAINSVIDMINGLIEAVNSVSGVVGITFKTIQHVDYKTDEFKAATYSIPKFDDLGIREQAFAAIDSLISGEDTGEALASTSGTTTTNEITVNVDLDGEQVGSAVVSQIQKNGGISS